MPVNSKESADTVKKKKLIHRIIEAALSLLVLVCLYIFIGRTLCKLAIVQIGELTNTKITTQAVSFGINGSVLINGLVVRTGHELEYDDAILRAQKVYVRFELGSLIMLRPRLKKISVHDFVFSAQHDDDADHWNVAPFRVNPPPGGSGKLPSIRLKRGILRYSRVINSKPSVIAEIPLDAIFGYSMSEFKNDTEQTYTFEPGSGYKFSISTSRSGVTAAQSILQGVWSPGTFLVSGGISSADIPSLERAWSINTVAAELQYDKNDNYKLKLSTKDIVSRIKPQAETSGLSPISLKKFPAFDALQKFFDEYDPQGRIDIKLDHAEGNLFQLSKSSFKGVIICKDASICKKTFPYLVEKITGDIDFTENSLILDDLKGRHSDVNLLFGGWLKDFGPGFKYEINIKSKNMALDNDLFGALIERWKKPWRTFSPQGRAGIEYVFKRNSPVDKTQTLTVNLDGTDAVYQHFPYPLKNLTGTLVFEKNAVFISDVVSKNDNRTITLNGQVRVSENDRPEYNITIDANNIPIDPRLTKAMPDEKNEFYRKFDLANFYGNGILSLSSRIWMGTNDNRPQYDMNLMVKQLQINEKILSLLPPAMKQVVTELRLQGKVDIATIVKKTDSNSPSYDSITVHFLGNAINWTQFPYPLRNLKGSIKMTADSISLKDITAKTTDNIQISGEIPAVKINGLITLLDGAFSKAAFDLRANGIFFDDRLSIALPEKFNPIYQALAPTGTFDLDPLHLDVSLADGKSMLVDFNGDIILNKCAFKTLPDITEMSAKISPVGVYKVGQGFGDIEAKLAAETFRVMEKELTNAGANIIFVSDANRWNIDDFAADCHNGIVKGKLEFLLQANSPLEYSVQTGFANISLAEFLGDAEYPKDRDSGKTSGTMDGSLNVTGTADGAGTRIGSCKLDIADMKIGKLSVLAKVLLVLKITEPKDYAFDKMFIDSYIDNDLLYFRKIDLAGRSLAFNGSGSMNIKNRNLDITLTARGDRLAKAAPSVLQSLADNLSGAVVKMRITGDYKDPQVRTTPLPFVEDMFKLLGTKETTSD